MIEVGVILFLASLLVISNLDNAQPWMLLAIIGLFWVHLMVVVWSSTSKFKRIHFKHGNTEVDMISVRGYDPRARRYIRREAARARGLIE